VAVHDPGVDFEGHLIGRLPCARSSEASETGDAVKLGATRASTRRHHHLAVINTSAPPELPQPRDGRIHERRRTCLPPKPSQTSNASHRGPRRFLDLVRGQPAPPLTEQAAHNPRPEPRRSMSPDAG
jgi:hypothetical protein